MFGLKHGKCNVMTQCDGVGVGMVFGPQTGASATAATATEPMTSQTLADERAILFHAGALTYSDGSTCVSALVDKT